MNIPFLDLKTQYRQIETELKPVLENIMSSGAFIGGPEVTAFEAEFAAYCGSPYCVGLNSGTDALRFAMMALGIRPGDEVITVAQHVHRHHRDDHPGRRRPVFVDIDPATCTIDVEPDRGRITSRHQGDHPGPPLRPAGRHGPDHGDRRASTDLAVIEDACQAHGALYKGRPAGTIGGVPAASASTPARTSAPSATAGRR